MSINEFVAGAVGGVAGIIVGFPFDTTKLQMQIRTAGDHRIRTSSDAWHSVAAQGFKKGFFRGMAFPLASYALVNSTFFGVYGSTIKIMEPDHEIKPTNMQVYMAGCVAGTVQMFIACPVEVIKCTMQSQIPLQMKVEGSHSTVSMVTGKPTVIQHPIQSNYYTGPNACIRDIFSKEGVFGFFKGFNTMFIRDVPSYGLYLLGYELMHKWMVRHELSDRRGIIAAIVAGGWAGCISWVVVMPFDVIKSRLQVDHGGRYKGFFDCLHKSVKHAGFKVLFRGMNITMIRAFPVNAVTFVVYSQLLIFFESIHPERKGSNSSNH